MKMLNSMGVAPGGTQQMFMRGGSAPGSNPLPLNIPFFHAKRTPCIPSIEKWCAFHIPWGLELCISFNCCVNAPSVR